MDQTDTLVFKQYYLGCLSQASYLIGDRGSGRAVVVDPQRDVSEYLADAEAEGVAIERVVETHVHADFLSGHLELARATGARIAFGSAAQVEFDIDRLDDGERIPLGGVELEIMHTPGHTPESICVVVHAGDDAPYGVLTGDTLFIGDVGRPDLLGANGWSSEELARALFHSTRERLLPLPDETRVYPAHGAGSACGKNLSTETSSTIGEQRRMNYALAPMSEDEFVAAVCEGQSTAPMYFAYASHRNRENHPSLDENAPVAPMTPVRVLDAHTAGAAVLDTRDPQDFAAGHLVGSVNVGLAGRFAEMSGQVLAADVDIVLVTEPGHETEARNRLARIGFDRVVGYLDGGPAAADQEHLRQASRLTADQVARMAEEIQLVDVRAPGEIRISGTVPTALLVPLPELIKRRGEIDPKRPTVVFCAGGYRSSIAASTLRAHGANDVSDMLGGFAAWNNGTREVARPLPA